MKETAIQKIQGRGTRTLSVRKEIPKRVKRERSHIKYYWRLGLCVGEKEHRLNRGAAPIQTEPHDYYIETLTSGSDALWGSQ